MYYDDDDYDRQVSVSSILPPRYSFSLCCYLGHFGSLHRRVRRITARDPRSPITVENEAETDISGLDAGDCALRLPCSCTTHRWSITFPLKYGKTLESSEAASASHQYS